VSELNTAFWLLQCNFAWEVEALFVVSAFDYFSAGLLISLIPRPVLKPSSAAVLMSALVRDRTVFLLRPDFCLLLPSKNA